MSFAWRLAEWIWTGLREWRIGYEMSLGGEDAISERDARWMERRNAKRRAE